MAQGDVSDQRRHPSWTAPLGGDLDFTSDINVLCVDDNAEFLEVTTLHLEREHDDITTYTATSPTDGQEILDTEEINCIVSDYQMPRTNGIEFLEDVRARHGELPFILFTGQGSEEVASDAIAAGATDYLQKNADVDTFILLSNRIEQAVKSHRARREILEREERFRKLIERSQDMVVVVDETGEYSFISPSTEELTGHNPADLIGENAFGLIHPEDREEVWEMFQAAVEDPSFSPTAEFRYQHGDESWHWMEANGRSLLDDPVIEGFIANVRDITERKQHERQLQEETEFVDTILDTLEDIVYVFDTDGVPIRWNDRANEVLGYTDEEIKEMYALEFVADEDQQKVIDGIDTILEEGTGRTEARIVTKGGERLHYDFRGGRLEGPDGEVIGFCGIARDITDRVKREQELQRQNDRFDEFASVVSHDLRTPLAAAKGYLEQALTTNDPTDLENVDAALDRLDTLIDDLLTLAKKGQTVADKKPVALGDVAEEAWLTVPTAEATLEIRDDATIHADDSRLRELFENLFQNAVEHGGRDVTVYVGTLADGFYIEDDGVGIDPDDRDDVFNRQYTTKDNGTGFGLAIVQTITEAHGWTITITDSDDGGARYEITDVDHHTYRRNSRQTNASPTAHPPTGPTATSSASANADTNPNPDD